MLDYTDYFDLPWNHRIPLLVESSFHSVGVICDYGNGEEFYFQAFMLWLRIIAALWLDALCLFRDNDLWPEEDAEPFYCGGSRFNVAASMEYGGNPYDWTEYSLNGWQIAYRHESNY